MRSRFTVKDTFQLPDGEVEYKVAYEAGSKKAFEELHSELSAQGLTPWLTGEADDCVLFVRKTQPPRSQKSMIPVIMALFTVASLVAFGLLEGEIYASLAPGVPWYAAFGSYAACIVAILSAHEIGHRYVSSRKKAVPPTPYVIPGVPTVTYFLPALGILSPQRAPAVNRDQIFDIMLAGPLAALLATLVLYAAGEFTSVQSTLPLQGPQVVNSFISVSQINPSVFQYLIDSAFAPFTSAVVPGFTKISPVGDAATVGFLLTFVSLLPMAHLDGGYLFSAAFGSRMSRAATYLSVLALIAFDTPNYWALAVVVLLMAGRPLNLQLCDDVSGVSRARKGIILAGLLLAFLSLPIPQNLLTFPLG